MNTKVMKIASALFPRSITRYAFHKMTHPQVKKLRAHEMDVLNEAQSAFYSYRDFKLKTYHWAGGKRSILLVHGWEGQAGNFSEIVGRLLEQDFTVYAFDAPCHGFSTSGKTSMFDFSDATAEIIAHFNPDDVISHSFGGVATVYGLARHPELSVEKYLLLTTPNRFQDRIDGIADTFGLSTKIKNRLVERVEKEVGIKVSDLNISDFAPKTKVKKALIIHDVADKILPIEESKVIADHWPVCDFKAINGTGHFRILRTPFVHDLMESFLAS